MAGTVGDPAVPLNLVLQAVILGPLIDPDPCRPAVVPDANDFQHITPLERELVVGPWLIRPKRGDLVVRVNVILGVIIPERCQLL